MGITMKIRWNVIGVMLIITAILIMQIPVSEADAASSASDFKMDGTTLISYTGTASNVSIPSAVEVIGGSAFENNTSITQVTIPSSVKTIEPYAFWGCDNLERVNLGKGLSEVGDFAFTNCPSLRTVYFPENISRIGIMAFGDCVSLTDVEIPYTVYSVHDTAFDGCYRLEISYDAGTEGERFALYFAEKKKEMAEYEDIDEYEEVITPPAESPAPEATAAPRPTQEPVGKVLGSSTVVGNMAVVFMDNTSLNVSVGEPSSQSQTQEGQTAEYIEEKGKGTVKYTLVDGKVLADRAYYGSQSLDHFTLPAGTEEIGEFSFARSSLSDISIPEGLTSIGYGAFYHCDQLQEVELPDSVTSIAPKAFDYTGWLNSFYAEGTSDFLIAGDGILIAYKGNDTRVIVPEGIRQIGPEVFQGHTEIISVSLPDSLEIIGEAAFADCSSLTELTGMSKVKVIRDRAFYHCPLSWVELPDTVETVGLGAFARENSGGAVLIQGELPGYAQELTANRLSNEGYRVNAFDGVEYVLTLHALTEGELDGTVLDGQQAVYHGMIGHLEDQVFEVDYTYLTEEETETKAWPEQIRIGAESYERRGMGQLAFLTPQWQAPQGGGLTVTGDAQAQAQLSPQNAGYLLEVRRLNGIGEAAGLDDAYRRRYQQGLPMDTLCYTLCLYEGESGVAVTRLGKQALEVILPLPTQLQGQDLRLVTLDRNGQLEYLPVVTDGQQIRFSTDYLSVYGIYGSGTIYAQAEVTDGQAVITDYGKRDDSPDTGDDIHPKWILGIGLLFAGAAILLCAHRNKTALSE